MSGLDTEIIIHKYLCSDSMKSGNDSPVAKGSIQVLSTKGNLNCYNSSPIDNDLTACQML